jgi:Xaa-Pro aminopeptidase
MKNTTIILQQLRLLMLNLTIVGEDNLSAYIIPSSDAHHVSIDVLKVRLIGVNLILNSTSRLSPKKNIRRAECDQRLAFISGFDGSSGTAIVTQHEALLWTDARYYIQADNQMDDNWALMKDGKD